MQIETVTVAANDTTDAHDTTAPVKGEGRLRHHFGLTYRATVVLALGTAAEATFALPLLGAGWKAHPSEPRALVWKGDKEGLEIVKATLAPYRTDAPLVVKRGRRMVKADAPEAIDSLRTSIDYGPTFHVIFPR